MTTGIIDVDALQMPRSSLRHRSTHQEHTVAPVAQRASLHNGLIDTGDDEALGGDLRRPSRQARPAVQTSRRPEPKPATDPKQPKRRLQARHFIILGVCAALVLLCIVVHLWVLWMNVVGDPTSYTQSAHRDTATVVDAQGNRSQIRGFVDAQNHFALLVIPDGHTDQAHVRVGPAITGVDDPQHANMVVTVSGTVVMVTAVGPQVADLLSTNQQNQGWAIDLSQQGGS